MSLSAAAISENAENLKKLISDWHSKTKLPDAKPSSGRPQEANNGSVVVAARTRPFLPEEVEAAHSLTHNQPLEALAVRDPDLWLFVPTSKWNGISINAKKFTADIAFGPEVTSEQVYVRLIDEQEALETVFGGGVSCLFAYGQTGSGKTYTIGALQSAVSSIIFDRAAAFARQGFQHGELVKQGREVEVFKVSLQIWELLGKEGKDLLSEEAKSVDVSEDGTGTIKISASLRDIKDAAELSALIAHAATIRRTSATQRNSTSSRSHLFVTIIVTNTLFPSLPPGRLMFVDLAGSERAADRSEHGKERLEESKAINESLMCLKECVVARATVEGNKGKGKFLHIPYRSSKLTLALKSVFDLEATRQTKTIVIAHVSPHLSDAGHSNNTLTYITPFRVVPAPRQVSSAQSDKDPAKWSNAAFRKWLQGLSPATAGEKVAPFESALQMIELGEEEFVKRCDEAVDDGREGEGARVYAAFWKMIVAAKEASRPESTKIRLTATDPESWTHIQYIDWLEQVAPKVRPEGVVRELWERGFTMMKVGEAEFVSRMVGAAKEGECVTEEEGREVFQQMWKMHIAAKTGSRREVLAKREDVTNSRKELEQMEAFLESRRGESAIYGGGEKADMKEFKDTPFV